MQIGSHKPGQARQLMPLMTSTSRMNEKKKSVWDVVLFFVVYFVYRVYEFCRWVFLGIHFLASINIRYPANV